MHKDADTDGILPLSTGGSATTRIFCTIVYVHGPRPNDLYAWHFREMLYPPKRVLPVYGYPFEIRVACKDCRIDGDTAADAHFTAGVVEVTWRRLPKSNPRQSTLADFR